MPSETKHADLLLALTHVAAGLREVGAGEGELPKHDRERNQHTFETARPCAVKEIAVFMTLH